MAKNLPFSRPVSEPSPDVETTITLMRRVGPERFEVVTGTVKGQLSNVRVLETSVSLVVGRGTARKAIERQRANSLSALGLSADN